MFSKIFSVIFYLFLLLLLIVLLLTSAIVLIVAYPFDKPRRAVQELSRAASLLFLKIPFGWKRNIEGIEHIDRHKPYVIIINHQAMMDIPTLYFLPLNFRWVSKREVFKIPFFGQMLLIHGDIPIERGNARIALDKVMRQGRKWLGRGVSVAIFPEGTRSKDGEVHRFKAGAFTLAKDAGVDILPVVMNGTQTMFHKNGMFNWHNSLSVKVLKPISAEHIAQCDIKQLMEKAHTEMSQTRNQMNN